MYDALKAIQDTDKLHRAFAYRTSRALMSVIEERLQQIYDNIGPRAAAQNATQLAEMRRSYAKERLHDAQKINEHTTNAIATATADIKDVVRRVYYSQGAPVMSAQHRKLTAIADTGALECQLSRLQRRLCALELDIVNVQSGKPWETLSRATRKLLEPLVCHDDAGFAAICRSDIINEFFVLRQELLTERSWWAFVAVSLLSALSLRDCTVS